MRQRLRAVLERLYTAVEKRGTLWLIGGVVLLGVMIAASLQLRIGGSLSTFLPSGDEDLAGYAETLERFGVAEMIYADVSADEGGSDTIHAAAALLETRLRASPLIEEVVGGGDDVAMVQSADVIRRHAPQLLPVERYDALEEFLHPDAIADRMELQYERLLSPAGGAYQEFFQSDPAEIGTFVLQEVLGANTVTGASIERRRLVSDDGAHALVIAVPHAKMGDELAAREIVALMDDIAAELPEGAKLTWVGGHRFWVSNSTTLRADLGRVSTVGMILVFLVVFLGFRGMRILGLSLLAVVAATFTAGAAAYVLYGTLSGIAISFAAALSGITVDYVIHLHPAPQEGESRRESVKRVFLAAGPTVVIGAITSAAAFLVLAASPVAAHAQLGVASAAGVMGALLLALTAGPEIARLGKDALPTEKALRPTVIERLTMGYFRVVLARPGAALGVAAVLVGVSCMALPATTFESDMARFQSKDAGTVQAERDFEGAWGNFLDQATLVVPGDDVDAVAQATEELLDQLAPLMGDEIQGGASFTNLLPSRARQAERVAAWVAFFDAPRVERLRADLLAAAEPFGIAADAFEPFFAGLTKPPADLTLEGYADTALASVLHRHLDVRDHDVQGLVSLQGARDPFLDDTRWSAQIRERDDGVRILTLGGVSRAVVETARRQLSHLAAPALGLVAVLLFLYYGNVLAALTGVIPLIGGLAVMTAVHTLMGVPLSVINVPVAVPVFGLGVDYAIFLQDAVRDAPSDPEAAATDIGMKSSAILGVTLTTLAGGGAMLLADHPAIWAVGLAMVLGVGSTLVLSWLAVPFLAGARGRSAE